MIQIAEINELFQKLQDETPNCGGQYHFTKIDLLELGSIVESVKEYMLRFKKHQNPYYFDEKTNQNIYIKWLDPKNLQIEKVGKLETLLNDKLIYWSNHKTSLDCRDDVSELYKPLETEFKHNLLFYLNSENILSVYLMKFVDTSYCFGYDHVSDDTLIQTEKGFYILHFGWSS